MIAEQRHEANGKHHSSEEQEDNMKICHWDIAIGDTLTTAKMLIYTICIHSTPPALLCKRQFST